LDDLEEEPIRKRKPKKISQRFIIVLDDLSSTLRNPSVDKLLKTNRHWKSKVIISSQNYQDLNVPARIQLDYCLLFGNIPVPKLETFHKDSDLAISVEQFLRIYKISTSKKYNFLYVDIRNESFRINFNYGWELN
jgi:hypothetical protein